VLILLFNAQQILERRFSLMLDGDTFKELTDPAFTLDNYLFAILENDKLKFKSFFNVKRIFMLNEFYQEATEPEIEAFCAHANVFVENVAAFKEVSDQVIRKLVHAVSRANVFENYSVTDISATATSLGITIAVSDDKIVMPKARKDVKQLLRSLDDGIYEASLTARRYVTNSKRPRV
jgi:Domain of unknown function (DUF4868)